MALTKITGEGLGTIDSAEVSNSADTPTRAIITAEDSSGSDQNAFIKTKAKGSYYEGLEMASTDGHIGMWGGYYSSSAVLQARVGGSGVNSSDKLAIAIDANGHVTMPNQSAFLVHPASNQSNIPIDAVADTIVFGTERFDLNGDFSSNTFTAPVTGKYQFNCQIWLGQVDSATTYYQINLMTSNKTYYAIIVGPAFAADGDYWTLSIPVLADMDASDTAYMSILVHNSGTAQTDISTNSTFSGYLVA